MENCEESLNEILVKVRENFEKDGTIHPVAILKTKDRVIVVPPERFGSDEDKDIFSQVLRAVCTKVNANEIFFISESWMKKFDKDDDFDPTIDRVLDYSDKIEVIFIVHETVLFSNTHVIPVIREGNLARLGKLETYEGMTGGCRFSGILYKGTGTKH